MPSNIYPPALTNTCDISSPAQSAATSASCQTPGPALASKNKSSPAPAPPSAPASASSSSSSKSFKMLRLQKAASEELGIIISKKRNPTKNTTGYEIAHIDPDGLVHR